MCTSCMRTSWCLMMISGAEYHAAPCSALQRSGHASYHKYQLETRVYCTCMCGGLVETQLKLLKINKHLKRIGFFLYCKMMDGFDWIWISLLIITNNGK